MANNKTNSMKTKNLVETYYWVITVLFCFLLQMAAVVFEKSFDESLL